jgi:hypothetical protein
MQIVNFVPTGSPQKHGAMATFEQNSENTAIGEPCQFVRVVNGQVLIAHRTDLPKTPSGSFWCKARATLPQFAN